MPAKTNGQSDTTTILAASTMPNGAGSGTDIAPPSTPGKKGKQKKMVDTNDTTRLLQARISQLEQDAAGEKDQEAEIEREVKRANRDIMQQIGRMQDATDKIDYLVKRASELLAEMRRMERENQKNKKRGDALQKEKDNNRTELSKTITLKEKLEKLCRELQRDNNKLKNENKTLADTLKHSDASWDEKFSAVMAKLDGYQDVRVNPGKTSVVTELDELFRVRFKTLIEQYELRELHYQAAMRSKELELQYNMSRYDRERKRADGEVVRSRHLEGQVQTFTKTEADLRGQLNVYVDKFKQVEDTLNNSNDLFLSFRKEMEDMSKKTKRLEKENETLKRKHEATNANIIRMAEEREELKKRSEAAEKKAEKLMSIIRNMQQQGRKVPPGTQEALEGYAAPGLAGAVQGAGGGQHAAESEYSNEEDEGEEEDDHDYEDEDEGHEESEEDYEEEDEDEDDVDSEDDRPLTQQQPGPRPFGPERPPQHQATAAQAQPAINGH